MNTDTRDLSEVDRQLLESLAKAFDRRYAPRVSIPVNLHNGSTKFVNAMLLVIAGLATAAICGEVVVYGQVQAIAETVHLIVDGKIRIPQ